MSTYLARCPLHQSLLTHTIPSIHHCSPLIDSLRHTYIHLHLHIYIYIRTMIRTSWLLLSYHQQQQRTRFHRCHSVRPLSLRHRTWSSTSSLSIIGNGGMMVLYRPNSSTNRSVSRHCHCLPSSVCVVVSGGGGPDGGTTTTTLLAYFESWWYSIRIRTATTRRTRVTRRRRRGIHSRGRRR
jgi:hypothetical protein